MLQVPGNEEALARLAESIDQGAMGGSGGTIMSPAKKAYLSKFGLQTNMNVILNQWVVEVQQQYHANDGVEHEEEDEEGNNFDHDLPHGQEFQEHMKVTC